MDTRTGELLSAAAVALRLKKKPEDAKHFRVVPPEYNAQVRGLSRSERKRLCKKMGWPMWGQSGDKQMVKA